MSLRLKWRNDAVGHAGLELPDGDDSELVLTTRQSYQPNWLVDSVDDAVELLTGHDGDLVTAPFDIPVGRAAVVHDPFGNTSSSSACPRALHHGRRRRPHRQPDIVPSHNQLM